MKKQNANNNVENVNQSETASSTVNSSIEEQAMNGLYGMLESEEESQQNYTE
ncbi:DUF4021 domain-containing protein [Heyndrickxia sporothermodurans]|uniref:DUF4021 domain-containing protein n=1 Tax=Heyndrickxia sporothermodurans TaxID=46224 RepID=A0A150L0Q7_9BACI|nr:DUF4021 domain-containing protein [Heyndrickxia sporothermodurans]KYD05895.1 hypothetical protein B4102_3068 [Heyndrickxia sporothermodurans]MBL5770299.1 DUF4021 domain-containing protein [Heyndrickxia sporothermodurans]MBL5773837.1 DUF4021 domain-containing protein [Heyndrickxia sporothermodurans]MBL5780856.1 DUF4021 domain-containing protein [Heyndrickxia sporothermodurans]MBL5795501.1 DUF4021 domain-containing protein [Heyndrickxia sporothermodurans]